jgi:hypothetical protein
VPLASIRSIAFDVSGPVRSITSNWSLTHTGSAIAELDKKTPNPSKQKARKEYFMIINSNRPT